jgi:hypothetical protein
MLLGRSDKVIRAVQDPELTESDEETPEESVREASNDEIIRVWIFKKR